MGSPLTGSLEFKPHRKSWTLNNLTRPHLDQGSTEGGFLPSAVAKAEGAKKFWPLAEDQSQSQRFQIIEILNLFVYKNWAKVHIF